MVKRLRVEVYKLLHGGAFWAVLVLVLALASVMLMDSYRKTPSFFFASLYNTPLLCFLTIVFVALFIGSDFEERTLRMAIAVGYSRRQVLLAKVVTAQLAGVVIMMLPLLVHGMVDGSWSNSAALFAVVIVGILAMNALPCFFAVAFGDLGRSMAVSLLCYFVMCFFLNSDQSALRYIFSCLLPMGQLRRLALSEMTLQVGMILMIDGVWIIGLYLLSWLLFKHRDLE